jgi:hypothetical protein
VADEDPAAIPDALEFELEEIGVGVEGAVNPVLEDQLIERWSCECGGDDFLLSANISRGALSRALSYCPSPGKISQCVLI